MRSDHIGVTRALDVTFWLQKNNEKPLLKTGPWILQSNEYHNYTHWPWITAVELLARFRFGQTRNAIYNYLTFLIIMEERINRIMIIFSMNG
jgi:hypothetical protein